jgi:hypothetical protein
LRQAWQHNRADRTRIERRLDELTHTLSALTGLPVLGDAAPLDLLAGFGFGERRRKRRI